MSERLYQLWIDIVNISHSMIFFQVMMMLSFGSYIILEFIMCNLFYVVINFRGVLPVFTPAVWNLNAPPRVHIFMWFANNKILTRDNLSKRKNLENMSCLFCNEEGSFVHLFFGCCIARASWGTIF